VKAIRCGRGLGDSIYLESVVRHLIEKTGEKYLVASDWPDVFRPLGDSVRMVPFRRQNIDILAHYASRKKYPQHTQFRDCCINAGIQEEVELRLDWNPNGEHPKVKGWVVEAPFILVGLPRSPMGRTDGFGAEILPDCRVIQKVIDRYRGKYAIVQIGAGETLHKFDGIDINFANITSISELLDLFYHCSGVIGYVSFVLAAAEAMHKPAFMVWSRAGLNSKDEYIRQITPRKIIEHPHSTKFVIDDCTEQELEDAALAFLR
jgi:hypothetical protein